MVPGGFGAGSLHESRVHVRSFNFSERCVSANITGEQRILYREAGASGLARSSFPRHLLPFDVRHEFRRGERENERARQMQERSSILVLGRETRRETGRGARPHGRSLFPTRPESARTDETELSGRKQHVTEMKLSEVQIERAREEQYGLSNLRLWR